ncbi:MAG: hypothetical protein AAF961_04845 [Planctomycetota bacterium]
MASLADHLPRCARRGPGVLLTLAAVAAYAPRSSAQFQIDEQTSYLQVSAATIGLSLNDAWTNGANRQNLSGTIAATTSIEDSGQLPGDAELTISGAELESLEDIRLRLGSPGFGVMIDLEDILANIVTSSPPTAMSRPSDSNIFSFEASSYEVGIAGGSLSMSGLAGDGSINFDQLEPPIVGAAPAGLSASLEAVPRGENGAATEYDLLLTLPIDFTQRVQVGSADVDLEFEGVVHATMSDGPPPTTIAGDFNRDGSVLSDDLSIWESEFGAMYDGGDFLGWQRNFGFPGTPAMMGFAIAEPSTGSLLALAAAALTLLRRRPRSTDPTV